jgi:hypothetical protein
MYFDTGEQILYFRLNSQYTNKDEPKISARNHLPADR